ncbi:MAG: SRPBCC family protein [Bacteriovorax sp.]|nr:SRPBCC family protein [Rhizobacter sp.]
MRLTAAIDIDAPAATVWACIDEPDKIVRWVEGALEHRYLGLRNPAQPAGQKFVQRLAQGRKVTEFEGTLIAAEPLRHFAFRIPSPAYSSEAHFHLADLGTNRTHVDYVIDVTLHTLKAKAGAALLRVPLAFFVPRQMRRLRALAESLYAGAP